MPQALVPILVSAGLGYTAAVIVANLAPIGGTLIIRKTP